MPPFTRPAPAYNPVPLPKPLPRRVGKLKISDRCDGCGARAYVAAEIHGTDLLFCGHHFAKYETAIRAVAEEVLDERWQLEQEIRLRTEFHN